jgi:hypothetical protein
MAKELINTVSVREDSKGRISVYPNTEGSWSNDNVDGMYKKMLEHAKSTGKSVKVFVPNDERNISELSYKDAMAFTKTHVPRLLRSWKFGGSLYLALLDKDKAPSAVRKVSVDLF